MTTADTRAKLAALWDRMHPTDPAEWPRLDLLIDAPAPPGWAVWRAGGPDGPLTLLPALAPSAPFDVRRRYLARVVANTTGRCPMCGAAAGVAPDAPDPEHGRLAAYRVAPVRVGITHAPDCPATFTDHDRQHLDPRALNADREGEK